MENPGMTRLIILNAYCLIIYIAHFIFNKLNRCVALVLTPHHYVYTYTKNSLDQLGNWLTHMLIIYRNMSLFHLQNISIYLYISVFLNI